MRRCVVVCLLMCLSAAVFAVPSRPPAAEPAGDFAVLGWFVDPPSDPLVSRQWGLSRLSARAARARAGSFPVVVAVLDTGVDLSHPEFAGRVVQGPDFVDGGVVQGDLNGHGTHVAGIVAAAVNGSGVEGLAPEMVLLAVRVLDESGYGDDAWVAAGVDWAVDAGVDVINLSLGSDADHQGLRAAVARAVAADVVVVAAAGNDGPDAPALFPAALPEVLTVTASDSADFPALFSASGSHVALLAPGSMIFSSVPDGGFGWMSGTSQSAPFVSAAAGLLLATFPDWSAVQVRAVLTSSAFPAPDAVGPGFGFGVVDPVASLCGPSTPPGSVVSVPDMVWELPDMVWELPGCCLLPEIGAGLEIPVLPDVPPPFLPVLPPLTVPVLPPSEPWVPPPWLPVWPPDTDAPPESDVPPVSEPVPPAATLPSVPPGSDVPPDPDVPPDLDEPPDPDPPPVLDALPGSDVPPVSGPVPQAATLPGVPPEPVLPPGLAGRGPFTPVGDPSPVPSTLPLPVGDPSPLKLPVSPDPVQPVTFPPLVMARSPIQPQPTSPVTFPPLVMPRSSPAPLPLPSSPVTFPPLVMSLSASSLCSPSRICRW